MIPDALITQQTLNWIRSFIIEYNICPFAKSVLEKSTLAIEVQHATDKTSALEALMTVVNRLDEQPSIETTLLVFPSQFHDFFDYLDLVELAEALLHDLEYEGVYQLATFHPQYCFADVDFDDVSNYTNRSPYPMLHILRENSIDKALDFYGDAEHIPKDNIANMRKLGLDAIKHILVNCQVK